MSDRFMINTRDPRSVFDAHTGLIAGFTTTENALTARTLLEHGDNSTDDYEWWDEP